MQRPKYNSKGELVRDPFIYYDQYGNVIERVQKVEVVENKTPEAKNIVKFNPSNNFGLSITKDDESTFDVNIRFNPKRFFVAATDTLIAYRGLKNVISGIGRK